MMMPPCFSFHCQTRLTNSSRPRSCRVFFSSLRNWRSTTVWVAMPAWSVPGQPEHFFAQHAGAPGENVLDGVVEDVAEGEDAGHVRRRHDDRVGRLGRGRVGRETAVLQPARIPFRLDRLPVRKPWKVPPWGAIIEERGDDCKTKTTQACGERLVGPCGTRSLRRRPVPRALLTSGRGTREPLYGR